MRVFTQAAQPFVGPAAVAAVLEGVGINANPGSRPETLQRGLRLLNRREHHFRMATVEQNIFCPQLKRFLHGGRHALARAQRAGSFRLVRVIVQAERQPQRLRLIGNRLMDRHGFSNGADGFTQPDVNVRCLSSHQHPVDCDSLLSDKQIGAIGTGGGRQAARDSYRMCGSIGCLARQLTGQRSKALTVCGKTRCADMEGNHGIAVGGQGTCASLDKAVVDRTHLFRCLIQRQCRPLRLAEGRPHPRQLTPHPTVQNLDMLRHWPVPIEKFLMVAMLPKLMATCPDVYMGKFWIVYLYRV
ncbi:Uncharacterised protein [Klebsiella pneumoniae]|nr:Uncharacterised protein [Klebsiella pneumoniae]